MVYAFELLIKTRPLNLANVDCKIISCMVSLVLVTICSACIGTAQFGGMKGLQMIDHIFSMEAKIVEFVVCSFPNSGIFACDIASAFPSLSRRYLLWILKSMRVPRKLYMIIKNLHVASFAFVCIRNRLFQKMLISTGAKQGDPSAMQLFILAYDPLIRIIDLPCLPLNMFCLLIVTTWRLLV